LQMQFFKHNGILSGRVGPPKKRAADCCDRTRYPNDSPIDLSRPAHLRCSFGACSVQSRKVHPRCHVS
jgi:hypothetical protein